MYLKKNVNYIYANKLTLSLPVEYLEQTWSGLTTKGDAEFKGRDKGLFNVQWRIYKYKYFTFQ